VRDWNVLKAARRRFEVVLLSAERDAAAFQAQVREYPWLAVPFEAAHRSIAMSHFGISAIPRLIVLSPTGTVLVDNAIGMQGLSIDAVDAWHRQSHHLRPK